MIRNLGLRALRDSGILRAEFNQSPEHSSSGSTETKSIYPNLRQNMDENMNWEPANQFTGVPGTTRRFFPTASSFRARGSFNTIVNIVPQGELWVVERLGRYFRTLEPGIWFLIPFVDRIQYIHSSKEQGIPIPYQSAITRDNVMLEIDGVLFLKIIDPVRASYNIDNPIFNIINLAQTTMRSEIGKLSLDELFEERSKLNFNIVEALKSEATEWGVECKRYEIRDIGVSDIVRRSMDFQAQAERRKRKIVLESEAEKNALMNRAEGEKFSAMQEADARNYTLNMVSLGELKSVLNRLKGIRYTTVQLRRLLHDKKGTTQPADAAKEALSFMLATEYLTQLGKIAKETNTVVLSSPLNDPQSILTQAMTVMKSLNVLPVNQEKKKTS